MVDSKRTVAAQMISSYPGKPAGVRPERRWSGAKVIEALANVMVMKGVPEHIRSDNGPEFVANLRTCGNGWQQIEHLKLVIEKMRRMMFWPRATADSILLYPPSSCVIGQSHPAWLAVRGVESRNRTRTQS